MKKELNRSGEPSESAVQLYDLKLIAMTWKLHYFGAKAEPVIIFCDLSVKSLLTCFYASQYK